MVYTIGSHLSQPADSVLSKPTTSHWLHGHGPSLIDIWGLIHKFFHACNCAFNNYIICSIHREIVNGMHDWVRDIHSTETTFACAIVITVCATPGACNCPKSFKSNLFPACLCLEMAKNQEKTANVIKNVSFFVRMLTMENMALKWSQNILVCMFFTKIQNFSVIFPWKIKIQKIPTSSCCNLRALGTWVSESDGTP